MPDHRPDAEGIPAYDTMNNDDGDDILSLVTAEVTVYEQR